MTISSPKDANRVPMILGTLNTDGTTVVSIFVNPTRHAVKVVNDVTGSSFPSVDAQRDSDRNPAIWGVSSADGKTLIPIYVDNLGNLLTQTT